jgi:hypothetical protein
VARPGWLGALGNVRNVVRQEMISRQLEKHLPPPAAWVLDVGAGQGTQSIRLARAGHRVHASEPDADMRAAFHAALSSERAEVQDRVTLQDGRIGELAAVTGDRLYDVVLLLGVLMYRDMRYLNEIGTPARADDLAELTSYASTLGVVLENWYGVRIAVDPAEAESRAATRS